MVTFTYLHRPGGRPQVALCLSWLIFFAHPYATKIRHPIGEQRAMIPRLSKAGMPSRSEGWGGLFKDEQYRLIKSDSRASIRSRCAGLCTFLDVSPYRAHAPRHPRLRLRRRLPSLLRRGMGLKSCRKNKKLAPCYTKS